MADNPDSEAKAYAGAGPAHGAGLPALADIGLDGYAPYLMNRLMGHYNATVKNEISAFGLTTAKMRTLAVLSVMSGVSISVLAVFAVVEQPTLSRALDGLEADGLVERRADPGDSRSVQVFLTDAGQDMHNRIWPRMWAGHDQMFRGISDAERRAFLSTLQKMLANVWQNDL